MTAGYALPCPHPPANYIFHPTGVGDSPDPYTTCGWCNIRIPEPDPEPETNAEDRDDDRLATELFRRYGSVERGLFRTREHWVADAEAIRMILGFDAAFSRVLEEITTRPVHVNRGEGEARAASWTEGFDEAWRQRDELEAARRSRVRLVAIVVGLIAGAIAYWPVRLLRDRQR